MSEGTREQADPSSSYLAALKGYSTSRLQAILRTLRGDAEDNGGASKGLTLSARIAETLEARGDALEARLRALPGGSERMLRLFSVLDTFRLPSEGVGFWARLMGIDPDQALAPLLEQGLVAVRFEEGQAVPEFSGVFQGDAAKSAELRIHPEARDATRPLLPEGEPPCALEPGSGVFGIREADGLEPVLRLSALWQRASEGAFRQTQTGSLYKRDRDRLTEDPVLAGPIADLIEPLPDMPWLWLGLARATGLVAESAEGDAYEAAGSDYWSENAVHLPQMIAQGWLGLDQWHEQVGAREGSSPHRLAAPFLRASVLLWLAREPDGAWVAIDDLKAFLRDRDPAWDRLTLDLPVPAPGASGSARTGKARAENPEHGLLESMLLGPAYQLGLIRAAEDRPGGRRLVQVAPLGRYVLGLGPPPPPRETFDQFLFVQPNHEIVAYRQGLNPWLVGLFSRFLDWKQLGAALELRLTAESVYRGLEGGLSTEQMLERLERHGGRALPSSVSEAMRSWSARRERVNVHTAATLIEFATPEELTEALKTWPGGEASVVRLTDRIVLASDPQAIPFDRLRISGSRDYRQPPEPCLDVEPDGVTVSLDLGRSDLFINAELARLFDELPDGRAGSPTRRRFVLSKASLSRALEEGLTEAQIDRWYPRRTGAEMPPAARLLLRAALGSKTPIRAFRRIVLKVPSAEVLDGLLQHPRTSGWIGERLGPQAASISESASEGLRQALRDLGLPFELD